MRMALAESAVDFYTLGDIIDASADEGEALHAQLSPGKARPLRLLIAVEQPKTQEPKPAKPQCLEAREGGTLKNRPMLNNIGANLLPSKGPVSFFAKLI